MPFTPNPLLATYLKAFARSVLFSLGLDHVLIDFLANAAVGTVTVLIVIFFVALRIPRRSTRSAPQIRDPENESPSEPRALRRRWGFLFSSIIRLPRLRAN